MRRILIIAYYFPPIGGSGTQRPVKFVKYLPDLGWQPYVITTDRAYGDGGEGTDKTLLADIPQETQAWRVPTPQPRPVQRLARWLRWQAAKPATSVDVTATGGDTVAAQPYSSMTMRLRRALLSPLYLIENPPVDPALYWSLRIVPLVRRIALHERIDAVLTTVPPWSALLTGRLAKQLTGRPWIADFRDPWTENTFIYFPSPARRRFDQWLERGLISRADAVISVTEPCLDGLRSKASNRDKPFALIPNGWDRADFPDLSASRSGLPRPTLSHDQIVLLHAGSTYQGEPLPLLEALDCLVAEGVNLDRLFFHFVGYMHPEDQARIASSVHSRLFRLDVNRVPHDEALRMMRSAHVLLLLRKGPDASSGKIFEYMVSGRPVLTIGARDGVAGELVRSCGIGCSVDPDDIARLARILAQIAQGYDGFLGEYYAPEWEVIERFDRRTLTGQLVDLLDSLVST